MYARERRHKQVKERVSQQVDVQAAVLGPSLENDVINHGCAEQRPIQDEEGAPQHSTLGDGDKNLGVNGVGLLLVRGDDFPADASEVGFLSHVVAEFQKIVDHVRLAEPGAVTDEGVFLDALPRGLEHGRAGDV